ncbi:MAG: hypothetical protein ACRECW_07715 [Phyllobacterium sp.]
MKTFGIYGRAASLAGKVAAILVVCSSAVAGEPARNWKPQFDAPQSTNAGVSADPDLPGVKKTATPTGSANREGSLLEDEPEPSDPNSLTVGDWDITISGSVRYQIGFGGDRPGK